MQDVLAADKQVRELTLVSHECALLMPDGAPAEAARLAELADAHTALDRELAEAEAKHRLYTLLEARTKCAAPRLLP